MFVVVLFAADIISCVEFNRDGELLATGDKGGRVVIFQQDPPVSILCCFYITTGKYASLVKFEVYS